MNDLCSIMIDTLPSIPFTERRMLPTCPAIYFALSKEGAILYIGQTQSLSQRWVQHNRLKQLTHFGCALIAWYACSIDQLYELESQLIEQFQPLLNGVQDTSSSSGRVGIYVDRAIWHAFRVACVEREISSSQVIEEFLREQLAAWQHEPQQEPDHA